MRCSSIGEPLFQPCTVPQRMEAADKAAPCDSLCCSASWCFFFHLYLFRSCSVLAKVDRQPHDEAEGLIHSPLSFTGCKWDERLGFFFFLYWKGKADTIITAFALAMHSNLFLFWLFNTVDRWCLKCGIAHNFSSTLWIAQSFFFLSVSSSGYRDASIPSKYAKNVELYFVLLN